MRAAQASRAAEAARLASTSTTANAAEAAPSQPQTSAGHDHQHRQGGKDPAGHVEGQLRLDRGPRDRR